MTPTYSSFSFTPPASPSIHAQLSAQERWADLLITYHQAVNHVRQVKDEMFELRYSGLQPSISIDSQRSTIHRQSHQQLRPQSLFDINDDMQPTSRMWQGTHISPNLVQGAQHLKLELNEAVELSVVTLDILSRKKTTISLTAKSTGANLKQLLGFWEFNLSRNMEDHYGPNASFEGVVVRQKISFLEIVFWINLFDM
jgi:hypothetical protein